MCDKCTAEELAFLQIVARYGTKVQVRISETISVSSGSSSSSSSSQSASDLPLNQRSSQRFRWRTGRITQITPEAVTVRFKGGMDLRVLWLTRDVRLYRHTACRAKKSFKQGQGMHSISPQGAVDPLTNSTSNNDTFHPNQIIMDNGESESDSCMYGSTQPGTVVDPIASSSSSSAFSAAAAFLTQNFESDSDDDNHYGLADMERERERVGDESNGGVMEDMEDRGCTSDMMELNEFADLEQYNDGDGREWSADGSVGEGVGGGEGAEGGLLALEYLIRQYREGESVRDRSEYGGSSEARQHHPQGHLGSSEGGDGEEYDQFDEWQPVRSTTDTSHQSRKRKKGTLKGSNMQSNDAEVTDHGDESKENEIEEAACRLKDENDYFARLKKSQSEGRNRFCMGGSDFNYQEQCDLLHRWREAHSRPVAPSSTLQEDSCDAACDQGGEVEEAKASLHPSEDPDVPTPSPDVIIFGRLGKVMSRYVVFFIVFYSVLVYDHRVQSNGKIHFIIKLL